MAKSHESEFRDRPRLKQNRGGSTRIPIWISRFSCLTIFQQVTVRYRNRERKAGRSRRWRLIEGDTSPLKGRCRALAGAVERGYSIASSTPLKLRRGRSHLGYKPRKSIPRQAIEATGLRGKNAGQAIPTLYVPLPGVLLKKRINSLDAVGDVCVACVFHDNLFLFSGLLTP
jgi:hypothetical protein